MNEKYILEYVRRCNNNSDNEMKEFRDSETGVHYFVVL